jgi:hypothetical protein
MKIFISHASEDRELASQLAVELRSSGFDVWLDSMVFPGDNVYEKMAEALRDSDALVALLSPGSLKSDWFKHDISFALGKADFKDRLILALAAPRDEIGMDRIPGVLNRLPMIDVANLGPKEGAKQIAQALHQTA